MLEWVKGLFAGRGEEAEEAGPDPVWVAACVLLLEMAQIDDEFSTVERNHVVATLRHRFSLSEAEAEDLIRAATSRREEHYDLWHFTRQLNENCTVPEKMQILEEVWGVVYADGTLDAHEDYLAHKLAKLLNLNHPQLIETKLKAKNAARP